MAVRTDRTRRGQDERPLPLPLSDANGCAWSVAPASGSVFQLDAHAAADLAIIARRLADEHGDDVPFDDHDLLVGTEVALRRASSTLLSELVRFRLSGSQEGIMLVRGLALDYPLPATPSGGAFDRPWRELAVATVTQLMFMSALGDVISYSDEKDGRLIQDVCPVPGAENRQENTGSCLLELHTEDGFHPSMPHFISLLALRPDHGRLALTVAASIRSVLPTLDAEHVAALRRPQFRIRLASSFGGANRPAHSAPMPVLTGTEDDPDLCVDFHATEPMTPEGDGALAALRDRMLGALVGIALEPGDLLVIDNRKAVHGRTGFAPRYDGADRWLRRCFAVSDIRALRPRLYPASRVHRPLSEEISP